MNYSTSFLLPSTVSNIETIRPINEVAVNEMLDRYAMNWEVKKQPLFLDDMTTTDFFGVVRQDTKQTFQACSQQYEPFQIFNIK